MKPLPSLARPRTAAGLLAIAALAATAYLVATEMAVTERAPAGDPALAGQGQAAGQAAECDSCALRHQDLAARRAALTGESKPGN